MRNGGTIKDAAGNNATLTLASPTAAGSLAANKDLVISTVVAPGAFSISSVVAANGQLTITWGASSGVTTYTLRRGTSTGSYPTTISSAATSPTTNTGLVNGTTYYYMVTAVNSAGSTDAAAEATGSPSQQPIFTSIDLAGNAADGVIDKSERGSGLSIVSGLVASNYSFVGYTVTANANTCSTLAVPTYYVQAPAPNDPRFGADGTYKVCVMLVNGAYTTFGQSSAFTLDSTTISGKTVKQVVSGSSSGGYDAHTCAILSDNSLKCWGSNLYGELGYDNTQTYGNSAGSMASLPTVDLGAGRTAKSVAAGSWHTCAILDTDALKCWGNDGDGQLGYDGIEYQYDGNGDLTVYNIGNAAGDMAGLGTVNLGNGRTAKAVAAAGSHTCAILDNDALKCWGSNYTGELGLDDMNTKGNVAGDMAALPTVNLGTGRTAKMISLGDESTCAILDNNTLKCWGRGIYGNLGYDSTGSKGDTAGSMAALPAVNLGTGRTALSISIGMNHSCAILDDSKLKCWGRGQTGRLGYDSTVNKGKAAGEMAALATVNLGTGRTAKKVAAGGYHTCAILDNNLVKCWGGGGLGNDGQGIKGDTAGSMASLTTVNLGSGRTATDITAGYGTTCAILDDSTLKCWGTYNDSGQQGNNSTARGGTSSLSWFGLSSVNLGTGRTAKFVDAGMNTCAILDNDSLKCWGYNANGQLGYDSTTDIGGTAGSMAALAPVNLGTSRTAKVIAKSGTHTCAILDNESLKCWGYNSVGQLGYDDTAQRGGTAGSMAALAAVNLGTGRTAKSIGVGDNHTCAILDNNAVKCWGYGWQGQLGNDTAGSKGNASGDMASLGTVNLGAGRTAKAVDVGHDHTCAILDNDTLKCWGANGSGQLGYDDTTNRGDTTGSMGALAAVNLGTGRTAKAVSAGSYSTCVILDNDTAKCWGQSSSIAYGESVLHDFGSSAGDMATLPILNFGAGRTPKSIVAGANNTYCALLDNYAVNCWGGGYSSQPGLSILNLPYVTTISFFDTYYAYCSIRGDGNLLCWGPNTYGQLGSSDLLSRGPDSGPMAEVFPVYFP